MQLYFIFCIFLLEQTQWAMKPARSRALTELGRLTNELEATKLVLIDSTNLEYKY